MANEDYTPRKWVLAEVPFAARFDSVEADEQKWVCGMDSPVAASRLRNGSPVFYFDYEQLEAGLDDVYGIGQLQRLTSPVTLPDGTFIPAGNLYVRTYKADDALTTRWDMFEIK